MNCKKDNILLIMPNFYSLKPRIINELEKQGHNVTFFCGTIKMTYRKLLLSHFNKMYLQKLLEKKIEKDLFSRYSGRYFSKVLIFYAGEYYWTKKIVKNLRNHFEAEFVYYAWDSIVNMKNVQTFLDVFDRAYSFDLDDCEKFNLIFLPLFYSDLFDKSIIIYDYITIMTYYTEKEYGLSLVKKLLKDNSRGKIILFLKSKFYFFIYKLTRRNTFKKYKINDFIYKPLSSKQCNKLFSEAKTIIDIPLERQKGLTIRTIDALYNKKKLITTNTDIVKYKFYCKENIFVLKSNDDQIPLDFFNTEFNENFCIGETYSISNFCLILLGSKSINKHEYLSI